MRLKQTLQTLYRGFLNAMYPKDLKCVLCGDELSADRRFVCARCEPYFLTLTGERCNVCQCSLEDGHCPDCGGVAFCFDKLTAKFLYEGKVKKLMLDYKEGGKSWLSDYFSALLAEMIVSANGKYDAILFPPSTKNTVRRRGFDHMELVAKRTALQTGIPQMQIFRKLGEGEKQAKKSRAQRVQSSKEIYSLEKTPTGSRFLILDDVATTGSTLNALTTLLKKELPNVVIDCYTVARTEHKNARK